MIEQVVSSALTSGAVPAAAARPVGPMIAIGLVLLVTFAFIAFDWLHKTVAALAGAIVAVALALALGVFGGERPYERVHDFLHHDLGVLGVIIGTSIIVAIASASGLFHFVAIRIVKATRGVPKRLLAAVMVATVAFVTFLTIAPAVLIMSSLVLVIARELDYDPRPYIMTVAIGANSGALMTFASGIPTLMIGTSAQIPYVHFLIVSAPLAVLSAVLAFWVIRRRYGAALTSAADAQTRAEKVAAFDEWALVKDRTLFYRAAGILAFTIIGFATAQQLGVGLDFVAITGAALALLLSGYAPEEAIAKVKWAIVLFFVGLFVLIGTVGATGLLDLLANELYTASGGSGTAAVLMLVPFVFVTAGIVDNIPVAATMIPIVKTMIAQGLEAESLWWSLIAACNLGGNPTPVGSIAAVIALHALEKERDIRIGWGEYLKTGALIAGLQIVLVLAYINAFRYFGLFPSL